MKTINCPSHKTQLIVFLTLKWEKISLKKWNRINRKLLFINLNLLKKRNLLKSLEIKKIISFKNNNIKPVKNNCKRDKTVL